MAQKTKLLNGVKLSDIQCTVEWTVFLSWSIWFHLQFNLSLVYIMLYVFRAFWLAWVFFSLWVSKGAVICLSAKDDACGAGDCQPCFFLCKYKRQWYTLNGPDMNVLWMMYLWKGDWINTS